MIKPIVVDYLLMMSCLKEEKFSEARKLLTNVCLVKFVIGSVIALEIRTQLSSEIEIFNRNYQIRTFVVYNTNTKFRNSD